MEMSTYLDLFRKVLIKGDLVKKNMIMCKGDWTLGAQHSGLVVTFDN